MLTDGESRPFDPGAVADALRGGTPTKLVLVHVGNPRRGGLPPDGTPEGAYRPNPASGASLVSLATRREAPSSASGRPRLSQEPSADALGSGPTVRLGLEPHTRALGRFFALVALLPLGLVLWRRNLR